MADQQPLIETAPEESTAVADEQGDAPETTAPAAAKPGKVFTQTEVDQFLISRVAAERRAAAKRPAAKGNPAPVSQETISDAIMELERERGVTCSFGLKQRIRTGIASENPADVLESARGWFDDAGLLKKTETTTTIKDATVQTAVKQATNATPISDKGPPTGSREFDQITNPKDLTAGDIERLTIKHGAEKASEMIRDLAIRFFADKKFVP
jgi:hypothetical protein